MMRMALRRAPWVGVWLAAGVEAALAGGRILTTSDVVAVKVVDQLSDLAGAGGLAPCQVSLLLNNSLLNDSVLTC